MTIAAARTTSFGTELASSIEISYRSLAENWASIEPTWVFCPSVISHLCGIHSPNGRRLRARVTSAPRELISAIADRSSGSRIRHGNDFFFIKSDNEYVRFHAAQSIIVFGGIFIISIALSFLQAAFAFGNAAGFRIGTMFGLLSFIVPIVAFVLWVYLIVRSDQGKDPHVPGAAGIAQDFV